MSNELDKKIRRLTIRCAITIAVILIAAAITLTILFYQLPTYLCS